MGFWTLFEVASMPMLQVLIITALGAFMATDYLNLLHEGARKSLNKIVFTVFSPSIIFSNLAQTVTLEDMISWWFMPINIGLTFLFGGIIGWLAAKMLKLKPHMEGLFIATCSAGNFGNMLLILVPAICKEGGNPFGDHSVCVSTGLSYSAFSMALGGIYIWSFTYQLVQNSALKSKALKAAEEAFKVPNKDLDANGKTHLLEGETQEYVSVVVSSTKSSEEDTEEQLILPQGSTSKLSFFHKIIRVLHQIVDVLLEPPAIAAIVGFIFGAISWLKNLIVGDTAPFRVIQDSIKILGDGAIPCVTLILGGNLMRGLRKADLKPSVVIAVICVRYLILPVIGICVVKGASELGFLPQDPLYRFILLIQFTLPPAMAIGTMTQLFEEGQDECSVIFLWTYVVAALALTGWSTVYMWIVS